MSTKHNDNMPLISIIVPIFNCEQYLTECITSLITQSYFNIEIILIDDGSTDLSGDICKCFLSSDNRIKFVQQANSGVSSARNNGLELVNGDFIAFVDSDDYVSEDFIQLLYDNIVEFDLSICGFYRFDNVNPSRVLLLDIPAVLSHDALYHYVLCNNYIGGYLCNKLFRKKIVMEHNIRFNTNIYIGEDMLWLATYLKYVNEGCYISKGLYYYRINNNSALQKGYNSKIFNTRNISNLDSSELINNVIDGESDFVSSAMSYRFVRTSIWLLFNMLICHYHDEAILKRIQKTVRKNLISYLKSHEAKLLEKFVAIGVSIHSRFTYKLASLLLKCLPNSFVNKFLN